MTPLKRYVLWSLFGPLALLHKDFTAPDKSTPKEGKPMPTLYEVITDARRPRSAFGQTFDDAATADAYADAMRAAGYSADVSPAFNTARNLADALNEASSFYQDDRLKRPMAAEDEPSEETIAAMNAALARKA